jgi:cytochrome c-type biogenesis protein CcmH
MTIFWIVAALLVAVALLFVVLPLLKKKDTGHQAMPTSRSEANLSVYRNQLQELDSDLANGTLDKAQYQSAREELEGRVLEDSAVAVEAETAPSGGRWLAVAIAIMVPVLTVSLYLMLGKPVGLDSQKTAEEERPNVVTKDKIEAMVADLARKLKEHPDDAEGWMMLGRSYGTLHRFKESGEAYARAVALMPNNAQLLADYADVLAMVNDRKVQGEPEKVVMRALKADPNNIKALALAGTAAFERHDYRGAIEQWQKITGLVPMGSPVGRQVFNNINEARKLAGLPPITRPPDRQAVVKSSPGQAGTVSGTVSVSPALKGRVADTDTVFVFARDANVPNRPPLAILRKTVKDLPLTFTLNDSMAIMPKFKLSSASRIVVGARVSKSGNATPSPGDLQGFSQPVKVGEKSINITINAEVN